MALYGPPHSPTRMRRIPAALLLLALIAPQGRAQQRTVDEGTLIILHDGAPVGRESFRIQSEASAGGQAFQSTAQISYNLERISTLLIVDSLGAPLKYDLEVRLGGKLDMHLLGNGVPLRFRSLARTPHGEFARDYVMGENPLLLDVDALCTSTTLSPSGRAGFNFLCSNRVAESNRRCALKTAVTNPWLWGAARSLHGTWRLWPLTAQPAMCGSIPVGRLLRVAIPASGTCGAARRSAPLNGLLGPFVGKHLLRP